MGITYAPLWKVLERRKLPKGYLREEVGLSSMTVAKLFKNEPITFSVLDRICMTMGLRVQDVIRYEDAPFKKAKPRKKQPNQGG
jgi:putative transcriptional regulator